MTQRQRKLVISTVALLLGLALACAGPATEPSGGGESPAAAPEATAAKPARTGPAAGGTREVSVPSGTVLSVEFRDSLSSETSKAGDRFSARVVDPVTVDGKVAIAGGATVLGRVVEAKPSKKIGGMARLNLEFTDLQLASGSAVPISAVFSGSGKKQAKKDAATIGGAAAGGAVVGRIIGHQKGKEADGTTVGAIVGAAVGTAIAATNKNDPVNVAAGTIVQIALDAPLKLTVRG